MLFIPTGTDRDSGRRPWVVWFLAAACILVHLAARGVPAATPEEVVAARSRAFVLWMLQQEGPPASAQEREEFAEVSEKFGGSDGTAAPGSVRAFLAAPNSATFTQTFGLSRASFQWWQPFTSLFMHQGGVSLHLVLNLFFLFAFGVLAESRLGHLGFLVLYLAGGAAAGLAQAWIGSWMDPVGAVIPVIGASGAVSATMGAVFAMHPRAMVLGYSLIPFGRAAVSVQWLLAFAVLVDVLRTVMEWTGNGGSGIATLAHLGGLAFGLVVGLLLLATGVVPRNDYDLVFAMKQWRRRRALRAALNEIGTPGASGAVAARVSAERESVETAEQRSLRTQIAAAHRARDEARAADLYKALVATLPEATLPAAIQLDVANEFLHRGDFAAAAHAYRRFLARFRTHGSADDVRLMLASIEWRRLGDAAAARATLAGFAGRELDPQRQANLAALQGELPAEARR